ncbi:MAG: hypothetical protein Q4D38_05280 [Planctomycetia bacterium]|nr:hypothetical protein [Planctomycetia bacterium]
MENTFLLAQAHPNLLPSLIGIPIGLVVGAAVLQLVTKWVCGVKLPYGMAFLYNLLVSLASIVISAGVGFGVGYFGTPLNMVSSDELGTTAILLSLVATFLICPLILGSLIRNQRGKPIGYGNGIVVLFAQALLGIVVGIGLGIALIAVYVVLSSL